MQFGVVLTCLPKDFYHAHFETVCSAEDFKQATSPIAKREGISRSSFLLFSADGENYLGSYFKYRKRCRCALWSLSAGAVAARCVRPRELWMLVPLQGVAARCDVWQGAGACQMLMAGSHCSVTAGCCCIFLLRDVCGSLGAGAPGGCHPQTVLCWHNFSRLSNKVHFGQKVHQRSK